jgi:hypothetical protein
MTAARATLEIEHPSLSDRRAQGLDARDRVPPPSHSGWPPAPGRPDPVALLEEQNTTREPDLVPVRHGRMMVSPFTFYRGAAKVMAADLKDTPAAGLDAQLCGDAHLSNGAMAELTAEVKQDTRSKAGKKKEKKDAKEEKVAKKAVRRAQRNVEKAHTRDSVQALSKLCEVVNGQYRIVSQPPVIVPARDLLDTFGLSPDEVMPMIHDQLSAYRATLQYDRRLLLEKFQVVDAARKVVGVGSVGTRAFIVLLQGRDARDPLFLQVKEATASVLEAYLPRSRFRQHGERVVQGQRIMQAVSDIYLGWTKGRDVNRNFYWRQLRDMKGSALVEAMAPLTMTYYGRLCGWTLARAHARSGDPVAIAAYLGSGDAFDQSIVDFAERYADQNEKDYEEFVGAIRAGRLEAVEGV